MNSTAGKADPYWYEWNVGLENVVEMLHPDSSIASVEFQQNGRKGWDDVVVSFADGRTHYYQVKHSRVGSSLTFGSLVQTEKGASLLSSLFDAWKELGESRRNARFIVHTNREAGGRSSTTDKGVYRPALTEFVAWLTKAIKAASVITELAAPADWATAWSEWLAQLKGTEQEQHEFLSALTIDTSRADSAEMEERLIGMLQSSFATSQDKATALFQGLSTALRQWTTTRFDRPVVVEDVLQALSLSAEAPDDEAAAPPPPAPFFSSRQRFLEDITAALENGPKVIFLSGEPGAGKTSLVSSLAMRRTDRSMTGVVGLRYFAFRPITVESPVIPADADRYVQPERLWYTLLSQLRRGLRGRLRRHQVPVRNDLISWMQARGHVLRISDEIGRELGRDFVIVIDGIDHAARASRYNAGASKEFFQSLPGPDELAAKSVRLLVAGQPPAAYPEYPDWLLQTRPDVKRLDVDKLDDGDIRVLLESANPSLLASTGEAAVRLVRSETEANTLAAVFAADESRNCRTLDEFAARLAARRLRDGLVKYYRGIWSHATGSQGAAALSLACLLFVARERITAKILGATFPSFGFGELIWQQMLDALEPLLVAERDGYRVRHNDVRVFLHSLVEGAAKAARQTAMGLIFDYYWKVSPNRLAAHRSAFHLARESGRVAEWPRLHSPHWVFEAAALGLVYGDLQEECAVALKEAAKSQDWDILLQVACSAETLEAWEDRCTGGEYDDQRPAEAEIAFLRSEGAVTPVESWRMSELDEVLNDTESLMNSADIDRARDLLVRWFGGMRLAQLWNTVPQRSDDRHLAWGDRDPRPEWFKRLGWNFRQVSILPPQGDRSGGKEAQKADFYFELGWADASSTHSKAKTLDEAFAGRAPGFYAGMAKAIENFARDETWGLVRQSLESSSRGRSHFEQSFLAEAAWWSLRAGLGRVDNPWLTILEEPKFGLGGENDDRVASAVGVARALGWTRVASDTGSIGRQVFEASSAATDTRSEGFFIAIYRAAAVLGRIASTLAIKGPEVTGELVPPKEVRQAAEALWSDAMHDGLHPFQHRASAGRLALELVQNTVGLSEAHRRQLLEAAMAVQPFQWDNRRHSLWELYRRVGRTAELKAWVERWLGKDGWLWHPDTSTRETFLEELLPLAEELGEHELTRQAKERAAWSRITYRGAKDRSFRSLYLWLQALGETEPSCWRNLGVMTLTLRQAARAAGCDNEYAFELEKLMGTLAYQSGPDDVRRLLLMKEAPRDGEDHFTGLRNRIVDGAIAFVGAAGRLSDDDAIAIWCLALGWIRWHDAFAVHVLPELRKGLLTKSGSKTLAEKLARISPNETTRTAAPEPESRSTASSKEPDIRTGADLLKEVQAGNAVRPTSALAVIQHLQLIRPADYDKWVRCTLSQVGPESPYAGTWSHDDRETNVSLGKIASTVGDAPLWNLVEAVNQGIGSGDAWLQSVTDNLFDVLLARASARGANVLRTGIEAMCDMHERWLRGGRKTDSITEVSLPPAEATTTWADAVETSLDIILASRSSEVVASGLRATHAWVAARPDRIEPLFHRWNDDDWKAHWWLVLAERWAAEHPEELGKTQSGLEEIARESVLHLRLQAWLVLRVLAASTKDLFPDFPDNPRYKATDVPLTMPSKELLKTEDMRVGLSRFVDQFGGAESVLNRVEAAMGSALDDVKQRLAHVVLHLPEPEKPTLFPAYLHAHGDVFCALDNLGPALSSAFEQKLADQPLSSTGCLRLAHGYLNGEDAWIAAESPRATRDANAWPGEKLLDPGYHVPTDRRALEKVCHLLVTQSEVPEDELVVGAKVDIYRDNEDFEFHFWFEESAEYNGTIDVPRPVTTINSRTFPWRAGKWFEQKIRTGKRPLVHFAGSLNLLHHAGVQVIPGELWCASFGWQPRHENPLEWVSEGSLVARFERIHGPLRRVRRAHFRQPLLSRWLIKKAAWKTVASKLAPLKPVSALNSYPSIADP